MLFPIMLIYCVFLLFFNEIQAENIRKADFRKIVKDYPNHKDFDGYLLSLERIIHFSTIHKDQLDLSYSFGLFLVNVNLKPLIEGNTLPKYLIKHLRGLVEKNDNILKYLNDKISDHQDGDLLKISKCIKDDKAWSKWLKKLELPRERSHSDLNTLYPDWKTYVEHVDDIDKWHPSPKQSDFCMGSLAENEENKSKLLQKCSVPANCYKMLFAGTNFGYGLTHRLLFLLLSFYSRGCTVFSMEIDSQLRKKFCKTIFTEAEYIASGGFKHVDLMFEQIALCALDGHAEILRRSWLSNLLHYQTPYGCFSQRLRPGQRGDLQTYQDSVEVNWKHDLMDGECNGHVTATAAASIAAAIRFLLENNKFYTPPGFAASDDRMQDQRVHNIEIYNPQ